jgi:hypothetical protein
MEKKSETSVKKLKLKRESVRVLSVKELQGVAGGTSSVPHSVMVGGCGPGGPYYQ